MNLDPFWIVVYRPKDGINWALVAPNNYLSEAAAIAFAEERAKTHVNFEFAVMKSTTLSFSSSVTTTRYP